VRRIRKTPSKPVIRRSIEKRIKMYLRESFCPMIPAIQDIMEPAPKFIK
jgi:hypothetical protein